MSDTTMSEICAVCGRAAVWFQPSASKRYFCEHHTPHDVKAEPTVTIPAAQHAALMEAARATHRYLAGDYSCNGGAERMFNDAAAALKAAGIETEG